jgi:hypothetical protein
MNNNEKINKLETPEISKSKYELTLSEFPIFILSKKSGKETKYIGYDDTIIGKDNEIIKREWRVFPDSEQGFGTASTLETLFDLFQIWKETGFSHQYIQFGTVYNLLKRKGLSIGRQQYRQIIKDLICLVGIRITAKNAFWDNERKAYVDMTFHLFDRLDLYKEKPQGQATLPFGRIKASDILYGSVLKNSLLTADFDSDFFHSLTPVEQRLSLYLSKMFRSQKVHKRELIEFAKQMPIYAQQTKHIRERLKKACAGLINKGFKLLESLGFEKGVDGKTEFVVFRRKGLPRRGSEIVKYVMPAQKDSYEIQLLVEDILEVCQDEKSTTFYNKVATLVPQQDIYRALSEVKEIRDTGEIRKNKGAIFTSLVKKYAAERGIEL